MQYKYIKINKRIKDDSKGSFRIVFMRTDKEGDSVLADRADIAKLYMQCVEVLRA